MKIITILILVFTLNACSLGSKNEEVTTRTDDMEFAVDTLADEPSVASADTSFQVEEQKVAETVIPDEYQAPAPEQGVEEAMTAPSEPTFEEFKKQPEPKVAPVKVAKVEAPVDLPAKIKVEAPTHDSGSYGEMETYKMQKGDTLMMVAFKIYGDYRKWKDLKEWNGVKKNFAEGTELKYRVPEQKFGWSPNGLPHLIKTGETLGIISNDKYGTPKKWRSIYDNNRPLIRNPNLIFAGFTIYYPPARDLASKPK